ncbi:hypothetical protein PLESTM_000627200 [Pleodorina starrii]|nr:hypothetical protein PLESTM_000627200 [Pleodorina starrii]
MMEIVAELFVGLGAGCQILQRQACAHLQVFSGVSAPGPGARWAAGPMRGCIVSADGAALQRTGFSFPSDLPNNTSPAWASGMRLKAAGLRQHCRDAVATGSAGCFASLAFAGSGGATTPISATAHSEHRSCGSAGGWEPQQQQQQQQQEGSLKQQQQQALVVQQGSDGQQRRRDGWDQLRDMSGTWIRNRESSDSMEHAMNLMRLNGIVRQAVKMVRGVRIDVDPNNFTFTVFSVISWFKVKEMYPLSGEERNYRRRDLRRGGALGHVEPYGQDVRVQLRWSDPLGGTGRDHFRLVSEDELHIESVIEVGGQTARYLTIYDRKKPDHRHRRRNGSSGQQQGQDEGQGQDHGGRDAHYLASVTSELGDDGAGSEQGGGGHRDSHPQGSGSGSVSSTNSGSGGGCGGGSKR